MVALWNRANHYIFILWFILSFLFLSFFPCLISAAGDWMSATTSTATEISTHGVALVRI